VDVKVNSILALTRFAVKAPDANIRPGRFLGEVVDVLLQKLRVCIKTLVKIVDGVVV
jgi:hypothetical protein